MGCSYLNLNAKKASLEAVQNALKYDFDVLSDNVEGLNLEVVIPGKLTTWNNDSIFRLPSNGEQKDDCGQWVHPLSCPNHAQQTITGEKHDRFVVMHTCDRPDCPVCYTTWATKSSKRATDRLFESMKLYRKEGFNLGKLKHVVFSPNQAESKELIKTKSGYKKLKSNAIKLMKKVGLKGGVLIFHPFRQNDPRESNFSLSIPAYVWYLSPHFHVVGVGFLQKSNEFYDETGWTYKQMEDRVTIQGTIKYTLTHCGISDNFYALTYFGVFSYNKVVIDEEIITDEPIKCRACGELLLEYAFKDEIDKDNNQPIPDWNNELGVFYHKVKKRTFKLRVPQIKHVYNSTTCGYDAIIPKNCGMVVL